MQHENEQVQKFDRPLSRSCWRYTFDIEHTCSACCRLRLDKIASVYSDWYACYSLKRIPFTYNGLNRLKYQFGMSANHPIFETALLFCWFCVLCNDISAQPQTYVRSCDRFCGTGIQKCRKRKCAISSKNRQFWTTSTVNNSRSE
jgi:hypothetical protein